MIPPLNLKLNEVDTSSPLLMEGDYTLEITAAEGVESKNAPGNYNLKVDFQTVQEEKTSKGEPVKAGFKLTRYFPIPPYKDGKNDEMFKVGLAKLQLAVCGQKVTPENTAALPDFDNDFVSAMPGKLVRAKVKTSAKKEGEENSEFGPRSEIAGVFANI